MPERRVILPEGVASEAGAHGVLRHERAVAVFGRVHVCVQLQAHRWQAPTPLVVVAHNGPLTAAQRMWVVLLSAPPGSMLHGLSAAGYDGLEGLSPDRPTVVIPGSSRSPRNGQLRLLTQWDVGLRWSTKLGPEDVRAGAVPPRTRLSRSLLDAASEPVSPRRARVIVLAGVQQRLVRPDDLRESLGRRGRCRNRGMIVEAIGDAAGGIHSLPEGDFDRIRRGHRLPEPEHQHVLRGRDGRYYLDNDWPKWGVRVEIHGIPHLYVRNWSEDLLRQNEVMISGGGLLVFSSYAVRHLPGRVGGQLEAMFVRRGWRG